MIFKDFLRLYHMYIQYVHIHVFQIGMVGHFCTKLFLTSPRKFILPLSFVAVKLWTDLIVLKATQSYAWVID